MLKNYTHNFNSRFHNKEDQRGHLSVHVQQFKFLTSELFHIIVSYQSSAIKVNSIPSRSFKTSVQR